MVLTGVIVLLSLFLTGVTFTTYQLAILEQQAHAETEDVLAQAEYEGMELLEVEVMMLGEDLPFEWGPSLDAEEGVDRLVITIGAPPGESHPALAQTLHVRINSHTSTEVTVQVHFVPVDEV